MRLATTQTGLCIPYRDETLAPTISDESADERRQAIAAHGDHFEDAIERHVLAPRFNWPLIPLERHRCTMAMALAAGLPARLSASAAALELANRKDAAGERLMHQTSKPRRARQDEDPATFTGLKIRIGSTGFMIIAGKTSKWSVNSIRDCHRYRAGRAGAVGPEQPDQ